MIARNTIVLVVLVLVAATSVVAAEGAPEGVVNINTAEAEQLQLLPRIGPALAKRIIEFRESHGPFARVDELVAVKGIGETSLETLRPYLVTDGATTLENKVRLPRSSSAGSKAG
jgi:competence protein ComEA